MAEMPCVSLSVRGDSEMVSHKLSVRMRRRPSTNPSHQVAQERQKVRLAQRCLLHQETGLHFGRCSCQAAWPIVDGQQREKIGDGCLDALAL